jgi:hypothetical protein
MIGLVDLRGIGTPVGSRTAIEEELTGHQKKLDVDKDGEIEGEDLAKLRAQTSETHSSDDGYDAERDRRAMAGLPRRRDNYPPRPPRPQNLPPALQSPGPGSKEAFLKQVLKYSGTDGKEHEATIASLLRYPKEHPGRKRAAQMYAQYMASQRRKLSELNEENADNPAVVDDHEGQMAKADLLAIHKNAKEIYNMLGDNEELEGWVQSKITKAAEYMNAVYNNMNYEKNKPGSLGDGEGVPADATGREEMNEVAPEGWEGTVKAMKKYNKIDNPWALAYYMKGKGFKSHKKNK